MSVTPVLYFLLGVVFGAALALYLVVGRLFWRHVEREVDTHVRGELRPAIQRIAEERILERLAALERRVVRRGIGAKGEDR